MLENEVVSFELAKTLKELGYPQGKSCFEYDDVGNLFQHNSTIEYLKDLEYYDAPLATELLRELPSEIIFNKYKIYFEMNKKDVAYTKYGDYVFSQTEDVKLQNNLAKMWIWLKESKEDVTYEMES